MIKGGLPASVSAVYTADTDPNHELGRQGWYSSKVAMQDNRLPKADPSQDSVKGGASIECYPDATGAQARYQFLKGLQGGLLGDGYDYLSGECLLRVTSDLNPTQAAQYQQLFMATT
jgi:hypothetical protein